MGKKVFLNLKFRKMKTAETVNARKLLVPLKFSSSYFYSIEPNTKFIVKKEEVEVEKIDDKYDHSSFSLSNLFLKIELNAEEERDIFTQIFRCPVHGYPVDKLLDLLNNDWDKLCWTQRQIKAFNKKHGKKILSVLNIEEEKLPNHLLFLGKNNGKYVLISSKFKKNSRDEFEYFVNGFEFSGISQYGFLVVPVDYPAEYLYEK